MVLIMTFIVYNKKVHLMINRSQIILVLNLQMSHTPWFAKERDSLIHLEAAPGQPGGPLLEWLCCMQFLFIYSAALRFIQCCLCFYWRLFYH
jgi:hypothetical protein